MITKYMQRMAACRANGDKWWECLTIRGFHTDADFIEGFCKGCDMPHAYYCDGYNAKRTDHPFYSGSRITDYIKITPRIESVTSAPDIAKITKLREIEQDNYEKAWKRPDDTLDHIGEYLSGMHHNAHWPIKQHEYKPKPKTIESGFIEEE